MMRSLSGLGTKSKCVPTTMTVWEWPSALAYGERERDQNDIIHNITEEKRKKKAVPLLKLKVHSS